MSCYRGTAAALLALGLAFGTPAWANGASDDPASACDRAAARAERDSNLPAGLLAAIGAAESGRADTGGMTRRAWPWSINAEGWSYFATTRTDAINTARTLQARGIRYIDVGCFQVDLFYHPQSFATLEEAFDPDTNARAASRILLLTRFGSTGWEQAVAQYHSASLMRGAWYVRRVLAMWPAARARLAALDLGGQLPIYAALLSPEARLVKIVTGADPGPLRLIGLPRVIAPADVPGITRLGEAAGLPCVVAPTVIPVVAPRRTVPSTSAQ